ncbi:hypothetical protein JKY72_05620 [Candidatus Gracilibacteria bacterium]|nr:hypothetical protein [Candidatus Gracilibacteria bacterium]
MENTPGGIDQEEITPEQAKKNRREFLTEGIAPIALAVPLFAVALHFFNKNDKKDKESAQRIADTLTDDQKAKLCQEHVAFDVKKALCGKKDK